MCGRYTLTATGELVDKYSFKQAEVRSNYNVAPTHEMPVIVHQENGHGLELMRWGLIPFFSKDGKFIFSTINARAEGVEAKPTFRGPFKRSRCLVPANGYFEWRVEDGVKVPYYFTLKEDSIMTFAGLYDVWHQGQPDEISSYTVLTTVPNELAAKIHTRMPVILDEGAGEKWLEPDAEADDLLQMLIPFDDSAMQVRQVSREVGNVRNNHPELLNSL